MANPYTRAMADFAAGLEYRTVPPPVRERIKLLILDALGCALYGAQLEWCRILQDTLAALDQDGSCSVWGTGRRLSAPHAALVNGTQVQGFELDDVHRAGVLHVGAVVLPSLLAIAELRRNLSGEEFLAAAVAGYEIGPRVGLCMGPEHIGQGWHSGATVGVSRSDTRATVTVSDDGVGGADPAHGSGLHGLAARVESLNGRLDVVSPHGRGTRIRAEIPLP